MNGREYELVAEMKKYRLELLGVSEAKVIGVFTCMYSGVQGGRAKVGVAILLSERFGR